MPTIRSLYTFKQFKQVFQAMAHEIAIEAVTNLATGQTGLLIKGYDKKLSVVDAGGFYIRINASTLSFSDPNDMSFQIEEKIYATSRDCTKISFYSPEIKNENIKDDFGFAYLVDHVKTDAEKKRRQNRINEFLEKLMKDAGLKTEPRFSLTEYQNYSKPEEGVSKILTP